MKNKKGFTLVELLAVIVILAIILAIAIPSISTMMNSASKNALESSAKLVLKGIEYKAMESSTFDPTSITEANIESELNIDDSNYQSVTVKKVNGVLYVTIVGKNKWDKFTVSGTKIASKVTDTVTNFSYGANAPVLATGMTPIKWDGSAWVDTTETDTTWYNYDTTNKKWANAKTADGSMWVWIPRYIYKIPTANWHTSTVGTIDIQFSKGIDDNWNKDVIGTIDLREGAEASNDHWTNHPAFTFGDAELTGIWIAKFDASSSDPAAGAGGGNVTNLKVKSIPNVATWRTIYVGNQFIVSRAMETDDTYGWGTSGNGIDTHLVKNTEWGAVLYFTQSVYGKNAVLWPNNSSTFIAGCAGGSETYVSYAGCENVYSTANGLQASTTGNIYGVYDMIGSVKGKFVAAYVDNGNSGLTTYGSSLIDAASKYKDIYAVSSTDTTADNYVLTINSKGDALYETSTAGTGSTSWYSGITTMSSLTNMFITRSNYMQFGLYNFFSTLGSGKMGMSTLNYGFRPTLVVGTGL